MTALERVRKICLSLPDASEGRHFGAIAFKVRKQLFATYHAGDDAHIVFGLEPDHADALIEQDPRFTRYKRDPSALEIRVAQISDWKQIRELLIESYSLRAPKPRGAAKKPKRRRSTAR